MLQLTPQSRILLATEPVDFRKGIDGLAAVCRQVLGANPLEGAVYVFRNRAGTALKLLLYDGQGYWLCMKRLSQGRFTWWPKTADTRVPLSARELIIVLWNGNPERAQMAHTNLFFARDGFTKRGQNRTPHTSHHIKRRDAFRFINDKKSILHHEER